MLAGNEEDRPADHGADGGGRSGCSELPSSQAVQIGTGHHLGGDADSVVARILRLPAAMQD